MAFARIKSASIISLLVLLVISVLSQRDACFAQVAFNSENPEASHVLPALYVQRLFLKHLVASYGKDDAGKLKSFEEATQAASKFLTSQKIIVRAETLDELSAIENRYFGSLWSLSDDLAVRQQVNVPYIAVIPGSTDVAARLGRYLFEPITLTKSALSKLGLNFSLFPIVRDSVIRGMQTNIDQAHTLFLRLALHPEIVMRELEQLPPQLRLAIVGAVHVGVANGMREIDSTGEAFSKVGPVDLPIPGLERFLQITLNEYFRHLSQETKLDIVAEFLSRPFGLSPEQQFEIMVMNAGPQFQKLFQAFAREKSFGAALGSVLKKLEQNTKPIPWRLVKPRIDSMKANFELVWVDPVPLGVGSMAQVHRARIRVPSENPNESLKDRERLVVIRVMKPGIRERMKADSQVLASLAPILDGDKILQEENFPKMAPYLRDIDAMMSEELSVQKTTLAQLHGREIYEREIPVYSLKKGVTTLRLHVPKVYLLESDSDIMVQEYVEGVGFEKFSKSDPQLAKAVVEKLSQVWLEEALFKSGFYHADLHQGNLRVSQTPSRVTVNLLDFGMTGQINEELQNRFLVFGIAGLSNDVDLLARALWGLTDQEKNQISLEQTKLALAAELRSREASGEGPMQFFEWVTIASNAGLHFRSEFASLNRGVAMIFRLMQDQGLDLDLVGLVKSNLLSSPLRINRMLVSNSLISRSELLKTIMRKVKIEEGSNAPAVRIHKVVSCEDLFRAR